MTPPYAKVDSSYPFAPKEDTFTVRIVKLYELVSKAEYQVLIESEPINSSSISCLFKDDDENQLSKTPADKKLLYLQDQLQKYHIKFTLKHKYPKNWKLLLIFKNIDVFNDI